MPTPVKYSSPDALSNFFAGFFNSLTDDLRGRSVPLGEIPAKYRGRSYKCRVMIEKVIKRKAAERYFKSDDFKHWTVLFSNYLGEQVTPEQLERAIRDGNFRDF